MIHNLIMQEINASTLCLALIDYRCTMLKRQKEFSEFYDYTESIEQIDQVLREIHGNVTTVVVSAHTCNPNV